MKVCSSCGQKKPLDAFYRQKGGAQGRRGRCKECYRAAQRAAWARDPGCRLAGRRFSSGGGTRDSEGTQELDGPARNNLIRVPLALDA
jgi:hypothetical protein